MAKIDLKTVLAEGEALVRVGANPDGFNPATQAELDALSGTYAQLADPLGLGAVVANINPTLAISAAALGANNGFYYRVMYGGGAISKIAVDITGSSGNICVAVYRNSGVGQAAVPGTRLATSGSVASPGSGYREISLGATVTVNQGDWLGISADNASSAFKVVGDGFATSNLAKGFALFESPAFPLPATPAGVGYLGRCVVLVGVP